ncbi:hypothetical protein VNI00_014647 [Paramarasmius palmivorus]|uniref:Uncharacterized protein n=1 Tax=Paramarasmius palmivorus TaxID=297713 RepID=A0AAW0BRC7_9AGAR
MDISLVWNIYFHFSFDKASSDVLTAECRKLVSASKSIEGWKNSKYGGVFQVCDERTLQDMREYWISYANFDGLSQKKKKGIWDSFSSAMQQGARRLSTGAPWQAPLTTITTGLHRFWSSGTIFKNDSEQRASANQLNPTFLYNSGKGDKFNLHYSINPLSSFYLDHIAISGKVGRTYQVDDFVDSARKQFQDWCSALSGRLRDNRQEKPGLVIRLFVGEVLQFCHAYHNLASPSKIPAFASKWTWSPINLTDLDGMGFDIIDACGLSHALGLANILVAASPLLKSFPVSTLYTDLFRRMSHSSLCFTKIHPHCHFCWASVPSHTLLASRPIFSLFRLSRNTVSRPAPASHGEVCPLPGGPQLTFDNNDLAFLIRRIYLDLFAEHEDVFVAKERAVQGRTTTPHYTRATLSELLRIVHTRMVADHWQTFINRVVDLISMEQSLIVGRNFFQDFCLHLVMRNLIEFSSWDMAPDMGLHKWKNSLCRTWTSVPPVIVLVVKFPRRKISVLEGLPIEEMCIPEVQCAIEGLPPRPWHNYFTDLQFAFGDVIKDSTQPHFVKIKEDPMGWNGKSDLIMALYVPSWSIKSHPTSFKISLCVYNTPVTARMLQHRLGVNLSICDIRGSDSNRVFVCPEMPGVERHVNVASSGKMPESNCSIASVELSKSKVSSIAVRSSCANEPSRTELSSGAKVSMEQHSPTAIAVTIGSTQMILPFPYFVNIDQAKLRIARKSLYIRGEAYLQT